MTYPNPLTNPSQANWPVRVNEALESIAAVALYAENDLTTAGLVWGYFGGALSNTVSVATGVTTALAASTTVYAVMHRTTGVLTHGTAVTNWNDTATYGRVRRFVTGASSITSSIDWRFQAGGIFDRSGAAGGALLAANNLSDVTNAATARTNLGVDAAITAAVNGLSWKQAVRAATTAALPANTYANGAAGVGATLTGNVNGALSAQDGVTLAANDRLLVKTEAAGANNGLYLLTQLGTAGTPYILTRATDADGAAELVNASVYVSEGTTLADTQWTCSTNATITVGTTSLAFAQLTSGGGSTQGRHAIFIAAGSMQPSATGGCAPLARIASAANQPDIVTIDFDSAAQEYAQFSIVMPKSWNEGTLFFKAHWSHAATTVNFGVVWYLQAVAVSDDDAIAVAFGTAVTSTDTGGTTNDLYASPESAAITVAGTPANEDMVFFRLSRVVADAGDTLAIDARLHGVTVYMTTNADTDA